MKLINQLTVPRHGVVPIMYRHPVHNWEYADSAERLAATGFISDDIGRLALQLDESSYWVLVEIAPITWTHAGGPHQSLVGAGTNTHSEIDDHIEATTVVNGYGNPNGVVTGFIGQTYRDLGNNLFYRCVADSSSAWEIV